MRPEERWKIEYGWLKPWEYEPLNMPTPDDFEYIEEDEEEQMEERWNNAYMKYAKPILSYNSRASKSENSDQFVDICKRYTKLTLDYSIPKDIKEKLQEHIKKEMEEVVKFIKKNKKIN
ncbi:hypothetical protein MTBBW1_2500002 [Desulfamplus magnetovallimortis]|uniref:Uncharacterized protein n=1 Tax=Desulfamplus magnetovallimortis TaxID=1246637 RepID=A0A1W1HEJ9_9BACT|nr:hypothetical protein [Desulfamplus magnetovallimortis]SLM30853.1 hypothetical protein MTBBW1_2500002 [Desulfamplus magnetovallimortis]